MTRFYLSGAMEYAPDGGKEWRDRVSEFVENHLKATVFNPLKEGPKILAPLTVDKFRELKFTNIDKYRILVKKLIDNDLHEICENTTALICYWDEHAARGGGTQGELTLAYRMNIPIYLITSLPITEISGWILGCSNMIFPDFERLFEFLKKEYNRKRG